MLSLSFLFQLRSAAVSLITTNDKMTAQEHISCKLSALKPPRELTSDFTLTGLPSSFHREERLKQRCHGPQEALSYQLEVRARASGTSSEMQAKQVLFAFFAVQVLSLQMYFIQGKQPNIDFFFFITNLQAVSVKKRCMKWLDFSFRN